MTFLYISPDVPPVHIYGTFFFLTGNISFYLDSQLCTKVHKCLIQSLYMRNMVRRSAGCVWDVVSEKLLCSDICGTSHFSCQK